MRVSIILATLAIGVTSAQAKQHHRHYAHHHHHYRHYASHHRHEGGGLYKCAGCVIRDTLAGAVAVSASNAEKLVGAINALWNAGFRGEVHCAAPYGTHVRHSLHHTGNACDMAQLHRNIVASGAKIMYHASTILAGFGVNDGCTFHDCGHISVGVQEAGLHRHHYARHYASRHHRVRYASQ